MQKQAPSVGRILVAVGFTLSCFGLILFLWLAFGGPIPLKPKSYRITAYFPEATQLAVESDVRIGGVSVGKVKATELAPPDQRVNGRDTTEAIIEIEPEFAPISEDARAILRQKTLLGETYVELTSGTEPADDAAPVALGAATSVSDAEAEQIESVEEGGTLGIGQTQDATQIDEIFNALDEETRTSFQRWLDNSAIAVEGRGLDLNDAFGNLGPFVTDASDVLTVLNRQKQQLKGLVRDTGTVFEALTAREEALTGTIEGSNETFEALAAEDAALAEIFQILPTFERESRATFIRLDQFQENTHPLIKDLIPVARDLSPTLRSVRQLSPNLKRLFKNLDPLIDASRNGLPALRDTLDGLAPVLANLDPFLANLNPILRYLNLQRATVNDFLAGPSVALSNSLEPTPTQDSARHYLRQLSYQGLETLSINPERLDINRGNGYLQPGVLNSPYSAERGIFPNWDCKNLDYSPGPGEPPANLDEDELLLGDTPSDPQINDGEAPDPSFAPCFIQGNWTNPNDEVVDNFEDPSFIPTGRFPRLFEDP
jgi:ABC-type transporter Mla subunit MlaD